MATDLTLYLDDQPGELARIGDVLGKAGANIAGLCAVASGGGQAEVHILIDDATAAFEALQGAGIRIATEQEVLVLDIEDRPGALGEIAHELGAAQGQPDSGLSRDEHPPGTWRGQPRRCEGRDRLNYLVRFDRVSRAFASLTLSAALRLACLASA